jgi:hypothetical protein
MTFNEENAVHEITENTKQQTSETTYSLSGD